MCCLALHFPNQRLVCPDVVGGDIDDRLKRNRERDRKTVSAPAHEAVLKIVGTRRHRWHVFGGRATRLLRKDALVDFCRGFVTLRPRGKRDRVDVEDDQGAIVEPLDAAGELHPARFIVDGVRLVRLEWRAVRAVTIMFATGEGRLPVRGRDHLLTSRSTGAHPAEKPRNFTLQPAGVPRKRIGGG